MPLGATLYLRHVADVLDAADGGPLTGHTFTGHTLACAAGAAVQRIVRRDGLLERVRRDGERLRTAVSRELEDVAAIGDVRGRGFFIGIELVADRATREPFDPSLQLCARVGRAAAAEGLLIYPVGGNVDGVKGDAVILAPPFNATADELGEIVALLGRAIRAALGGLPRG